MLEELREVCPNDVLFKAILGEAIEIEREDSTLLVFPKRYEFFEDMLYSFVREANIDHPDDWDIKFCSNHEYRCAHCDEEE